MVRYNTIEISIHAPLAGRDDSGSLRTNNGALFQSTRPLRGATARARRPGATAPISIHAPLAGRDVAVPGHAADTIGFQSTHPLRGATTTKVDVYTSIGISIHAPLAGCDRTAAVRRRVCGDFNPRTPCGARLHTRRASRACALHFNPRAPCGARRFKAAEIAKTEAISIHAPLAGRDDCPRDGDRRSERFQSTRPLRGATCSQLTQFFSRHQFQSTRPLRGATHRGKIFYGINKFQSTRPLRGATGTVCCLSQNISISIHAPLAGRDQHLAHFLPPIRHFNPRAPCGARQSSSYAVRSASYFNPRAPCGARPETINAETTDDTISIHAPLAGRDTLSKMSSRGSADFNPRAPCGARHHLLPARIQQGCDFNPRAPCGARR